jgi:hypothetical protein
VNEKIGKEVVHINYFLKKYAHKLFVMKKVIRITHR